MTPAMWQEEQRCYDEGYRLVCGVDEAGAGPLAGPVSAAAVILPPGCDIEGLNDSKKLTERQREALYPTICSLALGYSIVFVDEKEIDAMNILNARMLAMERAIMALTPAADFALIDGNQNRGISLQSRTVVKGDAKSASIAAASVLAKVERDRLMRELDAVYPDYGFARHKGYGTKLHFERLRQFGPSPVHRLSFLTKL